MQPLECLIACITAACMTDCMTACVTAYKSAYMTVYMTACMPDCLPICMSDRCFVEHVEAFPSKPRMMPVCMLATACRRASAY